MKRAELWDFKTRDISSLILQKSVPKLLLVWSGIYINNLRWTAFKFWSQKAGYANFSLLQTQDIEWDFGSAALEVWRSVAELLLQVELQQWHHGCCLTKASTQCALCFKISDSYFLTHFIIHFVTSAKNRIKPEFFIHCTTNNSSKKHPQWLPQGQSDLKNLQPSKRRCLACVLFTFVTELHLIY